MARVIGSGPLFASGFILTKLLGPDINSHINAAYAVRAALEFGVYLVSPDRGRAYRLKQIEFPIDKTCLEGHARAARGNAYGIDCVAGNRPSGGHLDFYGRTARGPGGNGDDARIVSCFAENQDVRFCGGQFLGKQGITCACALGNDPGRRAAFALEPHDFIYETLIIQIDGN